MPRHRPRLDANQNEIVKALRKAGCSVQSLAGVGSGCVDLLVGRCGENYLIEVKDGTKSPSQRRLTDDEEQWHFSWHGTVTIVTSEDEALRAVGAL